MRKALGNRKGVAIEMAIVTMLVVFALSTILLVVAEMSGILNDRTQSTATERAEVQRVGDDFYAAQRNETAFDPTLYEDYAVTVEDISGGKRLEVCSKAAGKQLLVVEVVGTGDAARIIRWGKTYS